MKSLYLLLLLGLITLSGFAQKGNTSKKPDIYFETPSYDFGTVTEGSTVELSFKFFNSGTAPLLIKNVKPACGCTLADYPKEPIMPGKFGVIKANFNSAGFKGQNVHKSMTVTTNVPDNGADKVVVIYFKGFVK